MIFPDLFPFLALGARVPSTPAQYERLRQYASTLASWDNIPTQADEHGLDPLFYFHLQAAGIKIPLSTQRYLQSRTLQHAHVNQIRAVALAQILDEFHKAGIGVLVLKGAALAHVVYPRPGLRVMRDIDILVSASNAERAQTLLGRMGYRAPLTADYVPADFKHLPMAQREVDGMTITIEVHRALIGKSPFYQPIQITLEETWETLSQKAIPFMVQGVTAYTLGYNDMLTHIFRHMFDDVYLRHLRLINWADLVSVAEKFVDEIDWTRVAPRIRLALGMIHRLTPLSDKLIRTAGIPIEDVVGEIGGDYFWKYQGWPSTAIMNESRSKMPSILRHSFFPPAWWLAFYYGLNKRQVLMPGRILLHPFHLVTRFVLVMLNRAKKLPVGED
jgi:hypothetical protein